MAKNEINQRTPVDTDMLNPAGVGVGVRPSPSNKKSRRAPEILGFFAMPSTTLAVHNPDAHAAAMECMPKKSGTCAHCGIWIQIHVVIRDEMGQIRFLCPECAVALGCSPDQVGNRQTDAEKKALASSLAQARTEQKRMSLLWMETILARRRRRWELIGDLVQILRNNPTVDYYYWLAKQLEHGPLTAKQARQVARATSATGRRNRCTAAAWDEIEKRCLEAGDGQK
jgi:hypothetical protein